MLLVVTLSLLVTAFDARSAFVECLTLWLVLQLHLLQAQLPTTPFLTATMSKLLLVLLLEQLVSPFQHTPLPVLLLVARRSMCPFATALSPP
jgi:hypothetical protein